MFEHSTNPPPEGGGKTPARRRMPMLGPKTQKKKARPLVLLGKDCVFFLKAKMVLTAERVWVFKIV